MTEGRVRPYGHIKDMVPIAWHNTPAAVQAEYDMLMRQRDELLSIQDHALMNNADLVAMRQQRDALLELVECVEWTNAVDGGIVCPWCGNRRYEGHIEYCQRQATIALVRGDKGGDE